MIHAYSNLTQTRWNRGEFRVQLNLPGNSRPLGFCDGSPEDLAELLAIGEAEGAEDVTIHRKQLKGGREIWTLGSPPQDASHEPPSEDASSTRPGG